MTYPSIIFWRVTKTNIVSSLMTNFDIAQNALQTSMNSTGSAMEEHSKAMDSIELKLNSLKAAWQSFAQSFMDSNFLKKGIDALKGLVEVLEWLIDNFGVLGTIGLGTGIVGFVKHLKGVKEAKKTLNDVVNAIDKIGDAMSNASRSASNMTNAVTEVAEATTNVASAATEAGEATANLASTATETAEATANMASTVSEGVEATTNLASASTEAAEAGANVASVVTEGAEAAANAASATTESAEAIANLTSIVTEASEAFANMLSTITETTEAMANMASTATETAEAGANVVSTVTEVADAGASVISAGAEVVETGANVAGTVAEVGANAVKSSGGLGKLAGGLGKTVASAAKWVGIAGLVVAALSLIYSQYKKNKEAAAEERQEIIESSNAYLDAASSFEQAYIKYSGRTNLTTEEESELESAIHGTVDALGDKSSALQSIVNSSSDYLASLEAIKRAELEAAKAAAENKRDNAEEELKEAAIGWLNSDGSEVNVRPYDSVDIAKEVGAKYWVSEGTGRTGTTWAGLKLDGNADINEIIDYYNTLLKYQGLLEENNLKDSVDYTNVTAAIEKMSESIGVYVDGVYEAVKANYQWNEGIPKTTEEYIAMREAILNDEELSNYSFSQKMSVLNSLDSEYGQLFDLSSAEAQARKFVGIIKGYGDGTKDGTKKIGTVETFLNMRTAVNNNECTVGQYLSELSNVTAMADGLSEEERKEFNLAFGLDADSIKEQYEDVYNYISRNYIDNLDTSFLHANQAEVEIYKDGKRKDIQDFLKGLTSTELQAVANIKAEIDWSNTNSNEILKQIRKEADLIEALNFEANIEIDTTALETLNTALEESASAMGLSTEAIESLKAKYSDLDGYDPATLFERTANGVKINRVELEKLEKKYNDLNKSEVQKHIDSLTEAYNDNAVAIDKCKNAGERAQLIAENETYKSRIEELATYQAQLEGVTGAYQDWIDAQNTPEDYEGYESVATSREDIQEEIDRGFIGNKSKKYIDLLSGEDLDGGSIDDYANAWDRLDDKVTGAGHSINDFFTVNDDGDITATGIDRFFKSLQTDFKGSVANFNKETGKWTYDFSQENLQKIQDEWGIGIEAIQLLLEAAASAGYDIDWDGILDNIDLDTSSFETLLQYAESAQKTFNELELDGIEDVNFNFTATGVEEATSELEKARSIYIDLITNDDGTINLEAEGAEQMRVILSTLLIQKQQLEDSNIAINIDTSGLDESQQDIANAINAVKTFRERYKNLEIAVTTGQGIEEAKTELQGAMTELQGLGDAGVDIAAELILGEGATAESLNGEIDAAISAVGSKDIKVGCKLDETALGTLNSQILTNFTPEATVKITGIDDSLVGEYTSTAKTAEGKVKWSNDDALVVEFSNKVHESTGKVKWGNNTKNVKKHFNATGTVTWKSGNNVKVTVVQTAGASGTAHAGGSALNNGTAQSGRAFAHGDWGIKGNGVALGGELGREIVVRDGRWFTIGDKGAEFFKYKKNDIVFNATQTESLLKYGGIKGANPRGKMLASGTAFVNGSYPSNGRAFAWEATATESNFASKRNPATGTTYGKSSSKDSKDSNEDFEETIDLIEIAISRIERAIDNLGKKADNIYKSWSERNSALISEIDKVQEEIELQNSAYDEYMEAANGVGLSDEWVKKIQNGEIDIETITDETLKEKIDDYQKYYEAALECKDAVEDLKETEAELYQQRFDNVSAQYEGVLSVIEHEKNMLDEYISQSEAQSWLVSGEYYKALMDNEENNIAELKKQKDAMLAELQSAVDSGAIVEGSEAWYEMISNVDEVTLSIEESNTALLEYSQTLQQLSWEAFDILQERISDVTEEADFLIDLLSSDKLYDDNGRLTDEGKATMGLHGQRYNTYMYQADSYADEIAKLDEELAKDPYDQDLINRRQELLELQQESILAAQDEKEAIRDMVEEGIELELDALQERIDKYNEALDTQKDLYDYQKKVKEQTEEIASIEKQLSAYAGFTDEETKAKVQELKVSLEEAKSDLKETEYDKYISDQQQLLDELYLEYSEILNMRFDNVDALVEDMIAEINTDSAVIGDTIRESADSVGYTLSDSMNTIWDTNSTEINNVITTYGEKFTTAQTTTNNALNAINANLQNMITQLNSMAKTNVKSASTSSAAKSSSKSSSSSSSSSSKKTTTKKSGGDGKPKVGDRVKFVNGKYYYDSQGVTPLGSKHKGEYVYITRINTEKWATHPYHVSTGSKLGSGDLGWLKLNQLSGYEAGKKKFISDELAWTQENGKEEYIIRPSDGAILTPIARKGSVLNAQASDNLWNMANSPAEFIRENLNLGTNSVPNNSNINTNYTQHLDKVVFSFPNVRNYEEMLSAMQKDKNFERLISSMTVDRLSGKSALAKGKSIR